MKIRIAIADDHPLVISGLEHILQNKQDLEIIGTYTNGSDLMEGIINNEPDVLLLDIQMPGLTGEQLAPLIAKQHSKIRILALTNQDNVYFIKTMIRHGVLGYLLKTTREDTLIEAIHTVYKGEQFLEPSLKEKVLQDALQNRRQQTAGTLLTRREKEIIQLIASNYSSQEIADQLYLSKRTIDNHRLNLLLKLGVKNSAALIKKAIQLGLID
jgi:DNA-binding NarL/FixJ family response regulator